MSAVQFPQASLSSQSSLDAKTNQRQSTQVTSKAESSYCSTTCCKEDRAASITLIAMTAITLIGVIFLISILQADTGNMTAFFSKVRSVVHHIATSLETSPLNVSLFIVVMGGIGFVGALIWRAKVCCDEPQTIHTGKPQSSFDPQLEGSQAAQETLDPTKMSPGQASQGQASAAGTPQSHRASISVMSTGTIPAAPPMDGDTLHPNEQSTAGAPGSLAIPQASPLKPQNQQGSAPTTPASPAAATATPNPSPALPPGAITLTPEQLKAQLQSGQKPFNPMTAALGAVKLRKSTQGVSGSVASKPSLSASADLGGSGVLVPPAPEGKESQENL